MPIVRVLMYPGRTQQQKDDLAKAITDAVEKIAKAPRDQTIVVIQEVPKEQYYVGKPSSVNELSNGSGRESILRNRRRRDPSCTDTRWLPRQQNVERAVPEVREESAGHPL